MEYPLPFANKDEIEYKPYCRWCGKKMHDKRKRYCCKEHYDSWINEIMMKEKFWHQREVALKRDGHKCQKCFISNDEHKKIHPLKHGLHVHHIVPREWGGNHHSENLLTLCYKCHIEIHKELRVEDGNKVR